MAEEYDVLYDPSNDFYRLLDISSSATIDEIRQVYRQRAKEVHPDRNPQRKAWASQQFKRINEAYNVLTDDDLRAEYDRQRYFYLFDAFSTAPEPAKPKAQPKQTQYPGTYDQPKKQVNWLRIVLGLGFLFTLYRGVTSSNGYSGQIYNRDFPTIPANVLPADVFFADDSTSAPFSKSVLVTQMAQDGIYFQVTPSAQPATATAKPKTIVIQKKNCPAPTAQITDIDMNPVHGLIVRGNANATDFLNYSLLLLRRNSNAPISAADSSRWVELVTHRDRPVFSNNLRWPTEPEPANEIYPNSLYTIRLVVWFAPFWQSSSSLACDVDFTNVVN